MRGAAWTLGFGVILATDCERGSQDDRRFTIPDPWLRLPPIEFINAGDIKEIDPANFALVVAKESEALARLKVSAGVDISPDEVKELAGRSLGGTGGRLVLLRGLSWDTPYGAFSLSWRAKAVRVNHGCLGRQPLPVVRRGIVARLPDQPEEVYVNLCMAE